MIRLAYQFGSSVYSIRYMKYYLPQDLYSELCFVPFIYDDASSFIDRLAKVRLNNKVGFIDKNI